jgi:hypothetical protein
MYIIPLIAILLIALAIFASPIFAVILFLLFLLGLGAYKFLARGTEREHAPTPGGSTPPASVPGAATTSGADASEERGAWGERWPEQG